MNSLSAIGGILLYLLSRKAPWLTILIVIAVVSLGTISLVAAARLGVAKPSLTSFLYRASIVLPLTFGGVVSAILIWFTAYVLTRKGEHPSPYVQAVGGAIVAAAGLLADTLKTLDSYRPAHLAKRLTRWRYGDRFPQLYGGDRPEYVQAYKALNQELLSDDGGQIEGWGFSATSRRLVLIHKGL